VSGSISSHSALARRLTHKIRQLAIEARAVLAERRVAALVVPGDVQILESSLPFQAIPVRKSSIRQNRVPSNTRGIH